MKFYSFLLLNLIFVFNTAKAQDYTLENIEKPQYQGLGKMFEGNSIIGYYTLYRKEVLASSTLQMGVVILDNNLNKFKEFEMNAKPTSITPNLVYNHRSFLVNYPDFTRMHPASSNIFDSDGNKITKIYSPIIKNEYDDPPLAKYPILPLGEHGFLINWDYPKTFRLDAVNNQGNYIFRYKHEGKNATGEEHANILYADTNFILAFTSNVRYFAPTNETINGLFLGLKTLTKVHAAGLIMLNANNGETILDTLLQSKDSGLYVHEAIFDQSDSTFLLLGDYFTRPEYQETSPGNGFFCMKLNRSGKTVSYKSYEWKNDSLKSKISDSEENEDTNIHLYTIIRTGPNELYAIGEKYEFHFAKLKHWTLSKEFIFLKFDNELNLMGVSRMKHNGVQNEISSELSEGTLRRLIQSIHILDFNFVSQTPGSNSFTVVYSENNTEKKSDQKASVGLGIIKYVDGKFTQSIGKIESDGDKISFEQAKEGYILVSEYSQSSKKKKFHLEKLEY